MISPGIGSFRARSVTAQRAPSSAFNLTVPIASDQFFLGLNSQLRVWLLVESRLASQSLSAHLAARGSGLGLESAKSAVMTIPTMADFGRYACPSGRSIGGFAQFRMIPIAQSNRLEVTRRSRQIATIVVSATGNCQQSAFRGGMHFLASDLALKVLAWTAWTLRTSAVPNDVGTGLARQDKVGRPSRTSGLGAPCNPAPRWRVGSLPIPR